ncbi:MAG: hypothetical protein M1823_006275 [Watsoniomyces obsoletus]|nr:MAG: hypothetical protein M1823_006275 [Watsoniomyces obsoletus]
MKEPSKGIEAGTDIVKGGIDGTETGIDPIETFNDVVEQIRDHPSLLIKGRQIGEEGDLAAKILKALSD